MEIIQTSTLAGPQGQESVVEGYKDWRLLLSDSAWPLSIARAMSACVLNSLPKHGHRGPVLEAHSFLHNSGL